MTNESQPIFCGLPLKELRGDVWQYSSNLMCFLSGQLLGNEEDLASWAKNQWGFTFSRPQAFYIALAEDYYTKHLEKSEASQHHSPIKWSWSDRSKNMTEYDMTDSIVMLLFNMSFIAHICLYGYRDSWGSSREVVVWGEIHPTYVHAIIHCLGSLFVFSQFGGFSNQFLFI